MTIYKLTSYLHSQVCVHCIHAIDDSLHLSANTYRQEILINLSPFALHWLHLAVHGNPKLICLSTDTVLVLVKHECKL